MAFEANWKGEKVWEVGASRIDWKSTKLSFWSVIVSYSTQQWTTSLLDCDVQRKVEFTWQPVMTSSAAALRRSSKAVPKAKLDQNRGYSHWRSVASLIHYSFLNPGKTITSEKYTQQINEMHPKLQCLCQHWSIERAQFFSMTTHDHRSHNERFKSWMNWATKFCIICHIHLTSYQLTTTSSSISTTFCRENASTTSRRQKMLSKSSLNPEAQIFMLQE